MSVLVPINFVVLVIALIAYILKRDSTVDNSKKPIEIQLYKYTITPSRWFWRKVRENKAAVVGFVVVTVFALWLWLK
jgi:hypothetical protein